MTRIARHGSVRTFGKRNPEGLRSPAFAVVPVQGGSFGTRAHFAVRSPESYAVVDDNSGVGHLVAVVGMAAVLMAAAPPKAHAAGAAPSSAGDSALTEIVQTDSSGMDVPAPETIEDDSAPIVEATENLDAPPAAEIADDINSGSDFYLEVFINETSTGLAGHFRRGPDGSLTCETAELTEVGIKADASAVDADGWVRVDALPGVEYRIDEATQSIHFTTGLEGRATRQIDLHGRPDEDRMTPTAGWGSVLNYSLFATTNSLSMQEEKDLGIFQGVSGSFDARIFSPLGTLNQSFQAGYSNGLLEDVIRLNSTWTYSDVNRMMTYRAGDITSGGLSWTRPVYLGGFQAQRNFRLRSDLVTIPLPSFKGTAAVPSTLEIYTQNTRTYSSEIGEGPFEIKNLPIYSGAGEARVVLKDAQGRETEANLPFYASSNMLAPGLLDFSVEVGMPRRNLGIESFDYDQRVYGVATARYGLSDWLTLEAHVEGGEDLQNGGVGAIFPLAHLGVGSIAVAGSNHERSTGGLVNATVELAHDDWSFYGRVQRTFGDYHDIASITSDKANEATAFPELGHAQIFSAQVPRAIEQVAVSVPLPFDMSGLNLSYTHVEDVGGEESQIVGASFSRQVFTKASFYATAFADLEKKGSFGVFAGLSMPLGGDYSAATGVDATHEGVRITASAAKAERRENGNFSWRAQTSEGESSQRSASATYRSPWARFEAGAQQSGGDFRANAQMDGSVVVAGGGVFAANRINDAFAVVDVGAAGVDVLYQNRLFGKTGRSGKLLVTGLNSYEKNAIEIDPKSLPVDAVIPATKEIVMPAGQSGVKVDFGINTDNRAALVNLIDASGQPLEVGLQGQLDGSDQTFVVGYDGQTYIEGLRANNAISVTLNDGQECKAGFAYKPKKGEQGLIDAVTCR
jgi:outer membrane usher protein